MALVAITGDPVAGICNGHYDPLGNRISIPYTGVWSATDASMTAGGIKVVRKGDTGTASCGHTFKAMDGSASLTGPGGTGVHKRGGVIDITDNGGFHGPGVTGASGTTPPLSCT